MSVGRKTGSKPLAFITSLMVLFALVVPFVGTALANHTSADPTVVNAGPDDSAPAGTCNAFTVSAFGNPNNNTPAEFESVDIRATQQDNNDIVRDIEIAFCDPDGNGPGSNLTGADPTQASGQQTGTAAGVNPGRDCDDDAIFSTQGFDNGACPAGNAGGTAEQPASIQDECRTNANGTCTFGIISNEAGVMNVQVFFDTNRNDIRDGAEPFDDAVKTWTAGAGTARGITCTPASDFNPEGSRHEFRCTVTGANGQVVGGETVTFDVTAGPNSEEVGPTNCGGAVGAATATSASPAGSTTDNQGQTAAPAQEQSTGGQSPAGGPAANRNAAACGYDDNLQGPNNSLPGQDTIVAYVNLPQQAGGTAPTAGVDAGEPSVTLTKTWVGAARTIDCEPETATNEVGTSHDILCTVRDRAGNPAQGVFVTYQVRSGPPVSGLTGQNRTDANGQTRITISNNQDQATGTTVIRAEIEDPQFFGPTPNNAECARVAGDPAGAPAGVCFDDVSKTWTRTGPQDAECNDGLDNDGDGRTDFPNDPDCSDINDTTETHFPTTSRVATNLTIRYDPPLFKGSVGSPRKRCQQGREVTLKKVTPGPNRTVGRDTSNREGSWQIRKRRARGRFYAVVARKTFVNGAGDTIVCLRDKSVTINTRN